jgi:SNF2 family DNA or RNA helicase
MKEVSKQGHRHLQWISNTGERRLARGCMIINQLPHCLTDVLNLDKDMGLGKTLSTLALICLSLDHNSGNGDKALPTLVVTTKSSTFCQS